MVVEFFSFAHHNTTNTKVSSKLLSFEENGYTVAIRQNPALLFFYNKVTYFPIIKVKYLNICRAVS
jgi:hypothetical protein